MEYSNQDREILNIVRKEVSIINSYMTQVGSILDLDIEQKYKALRIKPLLDMCYQSYRRMNIALSRISKYQPFVRETECVATWYSSEIPIFEWQFGFEQVYTRLTENIKECLK